MRTAAERYSRPPPPGQLLTRPREIRMKKRVLLGVLFACTTGVVVATALGSSSKHAVTVLPSSSCQKLQYKGSGSPQFIIASDLPLQGANRALTTEMTHAIAFILNQQ